MTTQNRGENRGEVVSPLNGAAIQPGAHAGNTGGKKGRSGRKPDAYKAMCAQLVTSAKAKASVKAILADDRHPHFAAIYKHLTEHAFGKPVQPVSGDKDAPLLVRVIREDAAPSGA